MRFVKNEPHLIIVKLIVIKLSYFLKLLFFLYILTFHIFCAYHALSFLGNFIADFY